MSLPEAPVSITLKGMLHGQDVMVTLRDRLRQRQGAGRGGGAVVAGADAPGSRPGET